MAPAPRPPTLPRTLALIAAGTLLESLRSRLAWVLGAAALLSVAGATLAASLALAESARAQAALAGSAVRLSWVFVFTLHVSGGLVRDLADRGFEHWLSLPLSRSVWVLGRAAGFAATAGIATAALWPVMALLGSPAAATAWCAGLFAELVVMTAAATFFSLSLGTLAASCALAAGYYLLARSIDALRLIAHGTDALTPGPLLDATSVALDLIAWLLPALSRFEGSGWLADGPPAAGALLLLLAAAIAQSALLLCAALVDFHRRAL